MRTFAFLDELIEIERKSRHVAAAQNEWAAVRLSDVRVGIYEMFRRSCGTESEFPEDQKHEDEFRAFVDVIAERIAITSTELRFSLFHTRKHVRRPRRRTK